MILGDAKAGELKVRAVPWLAVEPADQVEAGEYVGHDGADSARKGEGRTLTASVISRTHPEGRERILWRICPTPDARLLPAARKV